MRPQSKAGVQDNLRQSLDNMKRKYPNAIITQSFLRFEKAFSTAAQGTYKFDVLQNEGTVNSTEKRLAITDRFIATSVALYIYDVAADSPTSAQRAIAPLMTFPNPNVLGTTAVANAWAVYNGYLRAIIDKDVIIDAFDCYRFLRVPDVQKGTLLYTSAPAGGTISHSGWYDTHQAFAKLTPHLVLNGAGSNELTLNMPESVTIDDASHQAYAVLYLRGMLVQNASSLNGR